MNVAQLWWQLAILSPSVKAPFLVSLDNDAVPENRKPENPLGRIQCNTSAEPKVEEVVTIRFLGMGKFQANIHPALEVES